MTDPAPADDVRRLVVRDLSKRYDDLQALDALTFHVVRGEVLGLVGPNGAGKTTAMRCITGIQRSSGGRVWVDGHDLETSPVEAKRRLAFIPDTPHPFELLTVTEHLRFIGMAYRVPNVEAAIPPLLEEVALWEKRDALGATLSRGMRQKLAVACAFLRDPAVLLFDEPLTGLDPLAIRSMRAAIRARAAQGASVIISSHLLDLVERLCDRVLVLHRGRALAEGTLAQIRDAAASPGDASLEDAFFAITGAGTEDEDTEPDAPA